MVKKKAKKDLDKEALSRLKKEMAEPRLANSVREYEVNQTLRAWRREIPHP
jgi:ribosomal protein L29